MASRTANTAEKRLLFAKLILRKIFLEDWLIKLIALAVTFGLWFAVTGLSTPTTMLFSNVQLNISPPENTIITGTDPDKVNLVVSGDARRLKSLSVLSALLDLSSVQAGERTVALSPSDVFVNLPTGVKLEDVTPNRLKIKIERIVEKEVPVKVETDGDLPANLEIYSKTPSLPRVIVRGSESLLKGLDSLSTEKIAVTGRSGDFTQRSVSLVPPASNASIQNGSVDVTIRIGEKRLEHSYSVAVGSGRTVKFTIYGPASLVQKRKPDEFKVTIDPDGTPQVTLPADMQNVEVKNVRIA